MTTVAAARARTKSGESAQFLKIYIDRTTRKARTSQIYTPASEMALMHSFMHDKIAVRMHCIENMYTFLRKIP